MNLVGLYNENDAIRIRAAIDSVGELIDANANAGLAIILKSLLRGDEDGDDAITFMEDVITRTTGNQCYHTVSFSVLPVTTIGGATSGAAEQYVIVMTAVGHGTEDNVTRFVLPALPTPTMSPVVHSTLAAIRRLRAAPDCTEHAIGNNGRLRIPVPVDLFASDMDWEKQRLLFTLMLDFGSLSKECIQELSGWMRAIIQPGSRMNLLFKCDKARHHGKVIPCLDVMEVPNFAALVAKCGRNGIKIIPPPVWDIAVKNWVLRMTVQARTIWQQFRKDRLSAMLDGLAELQSETGPADRGTHYTSMCVTLAWKKEWDMPELKERAQLVKDAASRAAKIFECTIRGRWPDDPPEEKEAPASSITPGAAPGRGDIEETESVWHSIGQESDEDPDAVAVVDLPERLQRLAGPVWTPLETVRSQRPDVRQTPAEHEQRQHTTVNSRVPWFKQGRDEKVRIKTLVEYLTPDDIQTLTGDCSRIESTEAEKEWTETKRALKRQTSTIADVIDKVVELEADEDVEIAVVQLNWWGVPLSIRPAREKEKQTMEYLFALGGQFPPCDPASFGAAVDALLELRSPTETIPKRPDQSVSRTSRSLFDRVTEHLYHTTVGVSGESDLTLLTKAVSRSRRELFRRRTYARCNAGTAVVEHAYWLCSTPLYPNQLILPCRRANYLLGEWMELVGVMDWWDVIVTPAIRSKWIELHKRRESLGRDTEKIRSHVIDFARYVSRRKRGKEEFTEKQGLLTKLSKPDYEQELPVPDDQAMRFFRELLLRYLSVPQYTLDMKWIEARLPVNAPGGKTYAALINKEQSQRIRFTLAMLNAHCPWPTKEDALRYRKSEKDVDVE